MNDFKERFKVNNRSTIMVAGATLSFVFLALLSAMNMNINSEKVFGLDTFYEGSKGSPVDPRAQYNAMYNNIQFDANKCSTEMKISDSAKVAGSYYWIAEGETVTDISELRAIAEDDEMTKIKPFSKDGQNIIAPGTIKFSNSNVVQETKDSIDISFSIGTKYVMELKNVKSWWCHIGKSNQNKHTEVIGAGGIKSVCDGKYIIGEANTDTTAYLYMLDSNGNKQPASFADLYIIQNGE